MLNSSDSSVALGVLAAAVLGVLLSATNMAQASGPPARLPAGGTPSDECIDTGLFQADQLKAMRVACELLAFAGGFMHGFVASCGRQDEAALGATCEQLATASGCQSGERLWYCYGVGGP